MVTEASRHLSHSLRSEPPFVWQISVPAMLFDSYGSHSIQLVMGQVPSDCPALPLVAVPLQSGYPSLQTIVHKLLYNVQWEREGVSSCLCRHTLKAIADIVSNEFQFSEDDRSWHAVRLHLQATLTAASVLPLP